MVAAAGFSAPGASVEKSCDSGQQDVTPVEVGGAFVEMGETEQDRCDREGCVGTEAALEEVLHPAAKEELLRNGDEEEGEQERPGCKQGIGQGAVDVQEA